MVTCELCGKQVKTAQALRGHKTFIHGITGSNTQQPVARLATEQQVSLLEDRLQQLERATGLRESDWNDLLSDTEPLTNKLNSITEQLSKLSDTVSKLSEQVDLIQISKLPEQATALQDLKEKFELELNNLAAVLNRYRDAFNHDFTAVESRIDKAQTMIQDLSENLSAVRAKLATHGHDGLSLIPQLSSRLEQVTEQIARLQTGVAKAQAFAVRTPTDDFERLELANGSKHTFRVYKGKRGLSNPHRVSIDLFLGDKYVDLAEPED